MTLESIPLAISFVWGMTVAFGISLFFMFRQMNSYEKDIEGLRVRVNHLLYLLGVSGENSDETNSCTSESSVLGRIWRDERQANDKALG